MTQAFDKRTPLPILGPALCLSLIGLSLGGCGSTSETFDCKAGQGVGCKSISQVNQIVDEGFLDSAGKGIIEIGNSGLPFPAPLILAGLHSESCLPNVAPDSTEIPLSDGTVVHRIQEKPLRVWIAPFQDEQGNLHEASVIHSVLTPGRWQFAVHNSRVNDLKAHDPENNALEED